MVFHRAYFPSKFGGKPSWLNPKDLPDVNKILCKNCSNICVFLLQLSAPIEEDESAFHRMIFVFICTNTACYKDDVSPFVILRCSLPKNNEFYSSEAPDYASDEAAKIIDERSDSCNLCNLCGIRADLKCSGCSKVFYCDKRHQIIDWKIHKPICKGSIPSSQSQNKFLFEEMEILFDKLDSSDEKDKESEEEDDDFQENDQVEVEKLVKNNLPSLQEIESKELSQYLNNQKKDVNFEKFRKTIKQDPDQVIRYCRDGDPILSSSKNLPEVDKCECGSERRFEFQIMPHILTYMNVDTSVNENTIDWATIDVYTCKKNCFNQAAYSTEVAYRRSFE